MSRRDRLRDADGAVPSSDEPRADGDPNAGDPGPANPDGTLGVQPPAAGSEENEPDGDASGRPGSATRPKPDPQSPEPEPAEKPLSPGRVRVKATQTALVEGMARQPGEVFVMDESDFERRKDQDKFERV